MQFVFIFLQAVLKRRLIWKEKKTLIRSSKKLRMIMEGEGGDSVNDYLIINEGFTIYIYAI